MSDFVVGNGHRLEIAWHGPAPNDAPTLVLLHEGLGSVSAWRDFPGKLAHATGCGALVYSRWGYGRSDPVTPPRPLTYMHDEGRTTLPAVLDATGVREAILVGHSDGGSIAIVHASSGSPRVRALVLEAAHVFCEDVSVTSIARARDEYLHGDLRARLSKHHDDVDGAFWGWNRAWLDPAFRAWNLESFLSGVIAPTFVIQGADDPYGTLAQVDAIERGVRGEVERWIVARCGHAPHREHETQTLERMSAFVKRVIEVRAR
jgi:pimeloyl-ACP methyl ester carboxylesterase